VIECIFTDETVWPLTRDPLHVRSKYSRACLSVVSGEEGSDETIDLGNDCPSSLPWAGLAGGKIFHPARSTSWLLPPSSWLWGILMEDVIRFDAHVVGDEQTSRLYARVSVLWWPSAIENRRLWTITTGAITAEVDNFTGMRD
jgi:hypothetical protein